MDFESVFTTFSFSVNLHHLVSNTNSKRGEKNMNLEDAAAPLKNDTNAYIQFVHA